MVQPPVQEFGQFSPFRFQCGGSQYWRDYARAVDQAIPPSLIWADCAQSVPHLQPDQSYRLTDAGLCLGRDWVILAMMLQV